MTCLQVRGIACVMAASFSQTYLRNAINNGFVCLVCPSLAASLRAAWSDDDRLTISAGSADIDFASATVTVDGVSHPFTPLGEVPQEIIVAGGAEALVASRLGKH